MKIFLRIKKAAACLSAVLVICLGTGMVAEAAAVYELCELVEGTPSQSGYIPTYDPVEELSGESIIEEDLSDAPSVFSDTFIETPEIQDGTVGENGSGSEGDVLFDDGEELDGQASFDDGSFSDGSSCSIDGIDDADSADSSMAVFSDALEEPEKLSGDEDIAAFSDEASDSQCIRSSCTL